MPKTRRKKINKSPTKLYRNSNVVVAEAGFGVKVAGYRTKGKQIAAKGENAKGIHIGRQYTGVPRGKTYPYGSQRQGFAPKVAIVDNMEPIKLAPRRTVGAIG